MKGRNEGKGKGKKSRR